MKYIKVIVYFTLSLIFFLLVLLLFSKGSIYDLFFNYSKYNIFFNITFGTLYFYINGFKRKRTLLIIGIYSLLITVLLSEIIYPRLLKNNIILPEENLVTQGIANNNIETSNVVKNINDLSNLDKAKIYYNKKEYTSAWLYADRVTNISLLEEANEIKAKSFENQKKSHNGKVDPKYIDMQQYKILTNQNRYLDAYYFLLNIINRSPIINQDFLIKIESCYQQLLKNYYSINAVTEFLKKPGYTEISFYDTSKIVHKYSIEKLVEFNNEYYIKGLVIDNIYYPYIYINYNNKIFSSGFDENKRVVIEKNSPEFTIKASELKYFSKEYLKLSYSSLYLSMRILSMKNIKYFNDIEILNFIFARLTSYASILFVFFMVGFGMHTKNFPNYLFNYVVSILTIKWFIKKIGLFLSFYGISLAFITVCFIYLVLVIIRIRKITPSPSRF